MSNCLVTTSGGDFTLALQNGFLQVGTAPYGGGVGNITISGPDVTGTGPTTAVPGNLSLVVTDVEGSGTANLARARFNLVVLEGPAATVGFPLAPLNGDFVMVTSQFSGTGAPSTVYNNQGSGIEIENPVSPGTYGTSATIADTTATHIYTYDQNGEHAWVLLSNGSATAQFLGDLSQSPNAATQVAEWWIDPANVSGNASDNGEGTNAGNPLVSFRELVRRWGSKTPILNQATTIQYLSYPATPANDPIDVDAVGSGNLLIVGPGATQTPVFSGTIAGLSALSQTGGTAWTITAYAGAAVGQMVINATRASSVGFVSSIVEGNATITQPMAPSTPSTTGASNNAWANGDSITAYPASGSVVITKAGFRGSAISTFVGLGLQRLNWSGLVPTLSGDELNIVECYGAALSYTFLAADLLLANVRNGLQTNLASLSNCGTSYQNPVLQFFGGAVLQTLNAESALFAQNFYIQNSGSVRYATVGTTGLGIINGILSVGLGMLINHNAGVVWGSDSGTLNAAGAARITYVNGTAEQCFLGPLTLALNGQALGLSRLSTGGTYAWFGNIALTPANLDASPASTTAFNGLAFSASGSAVFAGNGLL